MSKIDHYEFWAMTNEGEEVCLVCETEDESKIAMSNWCFERYDEGWFAATLYSPRDNDPEFAKKLTRDRFAKKSKKNPKRTI